MNIMALALVLCFLPGLFTFASACSNGACQLLESCTKPEDCGSGMYCGNCPASGKNSPICVRGQATRVSSLINNLPYNKYTWLTTHNAFSIIGEPSNTGTSRVTFYNQEDTVTNQLNNGVRGFMLDMYDFMGDIWLCHSFGGQCYNITAFEPAIKTLNEIEFFLSANPSEIVTIFIEDYVHTPNGLSKIFTDAGLMKYWFPVANMPKKGENWPTLSEMISSNRRLVVFTSISSKEETEGIAYQWRYIAENEPGDGGVRQGSCSNRKESVALSTKVASLFLMNYFTTIPDQSGSCKEHSTELLQMVNTCYKSSGRVPNFIAVNFYMRSDGGGVFEAVDRINGKSLCGCSTVTACQAGVPNGVCKNIAVPYSSPITGGSSPATGSSPESEGSSTTLEPFDSSDSSYIHLLHPLAIFILLLLSAYISRTTS